MIEHVWYNPASDEVFVGSEITHQLWLYLVELYNPAGTIYLGEL